MVDVKVVGPPSPSAAGGAKLPPSSSLARPHTSTRKSPPARSRVPFQANHVPPAPDVAPLHETMSGPIASAVVLPEPDDAPPPAASPSNALKRRQSSVADDAPGDSAKRARTNGDDANNDIAEEGKPAAPKRRERGRERRLFGAVLGALSQAPTTAGQKRRSEIEKRQAAQRRQEDEESEQRKAERLARRKVQRGKETRRFERMAVCWVKS